MFVGGSFAAYLSILYTGTEPIEIGTVLSCDTIVFPSPYVPWAQEFNITFDIGNVLDVDVTGARLNIEFVLNNPQGTFGAGSISFVDMMPLTGYLATYAYEGFTGGVWYFNSSYSSDSGLITIPAAGVSSFWITFKILTLADSVDWVIYWSD